MKTSPLAALTAILAALLVIATAAPALAHDALKSSSPAKGATVESLDEVKLEFTGKVRMPFVIVRGEGDAQHESGEPEADGAVVTQAVAGPLPDGRYTIAYRVVSSDGHPIEGEIPFRVKGAPTPTPSATESASAPAEPAASASGDAAPPASSGPPTPAAAAASLAADEAAADEGVTFPVWLIIVVGALIGIGVGFLLSARRSKP
ncbi:copper resistance CopC family protein [Nonomuraea aridisoli]|uniref:Copper resistance protein CopC n=1 Tax=Nonomuraea aridisoli TaxID=2070368 RepID=A0A2W2E4J5_9ACTN|nr:copper resistance CopC family protein [Nonomuraea aridisoli]PZG11549.1 copper resistance protein CopC [Nonomuraea aridisoli]